MAPKPKKTSPTWSDVKRKMAEFDRAGLLGTIQDLYAASKDCEPAVSFGADQHEKTLKSPITPGLPRPR